MLQVSRATTPDLKNKVAHEKSGAVSTPLPSLSLIMLAEAAITFSTPPNIAMSHVRE